MATVTRTFELSEEAVRRLDAMAAANKSSADALVDRLLNPVPIEFTATQLRQIEQAIREDDAGDYASEEEVKGAFESFRS